MKSSLVSWPEPSASSSLKLREGREGGREGEREGGRDREVRVVPWGEERGVEVKVRAHAL